MPFLIQMPLQITVIVPESLKIQPNTVRPLIYTTWAVGTDTKSENVIRFTFLKSAKTKT